MSIFRKGKKENAPINAMLQKLINEYKDEIKSIDDFYDAISYYQNSQTLNFTLEALIDFLEEEKERLNNSLLLQTNPQKLSQIYKEIARIDYIKNFIEKYIRLSLDKKYSINPIDYEQTTLANFLLILKKRKNYINEVLIPNKHKN